MVSMLVFGLSGPVSSPCWGHRVAFLALYSQVPLSTQVYKWVLMNLMLGVTLR